MKRFMINGWRESEARFLNLGRFTEEEMIKLMNGEVVHKGDNEFYIIIEE